MNVKKMLTNYKLVKKTYSKLNHINRLFKKANDYSDDFGKVMLMVSSIFLVPVILLQTTSLSSLFLLIYPLGTLAACITYLKKERIRFNKEFKDIKVLKTIVDQNVFTNRQNNYKMRDFYNKNLNKEEAILISNIVQIKEDIYVDKCNKYKKNNPKKRFQTNSSYEREVIIYANKNKSSLYSIVLYIFSNVEAIELKKIPLEELNDILKDFNLEEKIELTSLVNSRIKEYTQQVEDIHLNLNVLNNNIEEDIKECSEEVFVINKHIVKVV
jgi:hypothetical protein